MSAEIDSYEWIRRSALGFWSKADGGRYLAFCMWTMRSGALIDPSPIGGEVEGAKSALFWGWLRESSLALELIIKAALAQKEDYREGRASVPSTHNLPQLWKMAQLPKTSLQQEDHLRSAHQVLQWSGRYSAPRRGSDDLHVGRETSPHSKRDDKSSASLSLKMQWESFDTLYQMAQAAYFAELDELAY
jgi:hypothetical protein